MPEFEGPARRAASQRSFTSVIIADSANLSTQAIDMDGYAMLGIEIPASFDGTEISFQVAVDEPSPPLPQATYQQLFDSDDTLVTITVQAGRSYSLVVDDFVMLLPWRYIRMNATTVQAGPTTIRLTLTS